MSEVQSYREMLRQEFRGRSKRNPGYSVRAFARDLRISPAFLSQILNHRRSLAEEKGYQIARQLSWGAGKTKRFVTSLRVENCRDPKVKSQLLEELRPARTSKPKDLGFELSRVIANWRHFAILELTTVDGFVSDAGWIADRLGIDASAASEAIERLLRVGMLERRDGRLGKVSPDYSTPTDVPALAIRKAHAEIMGRAKHALELQPVDAREFRAMTVATDPKRLPEIKKRIREFQQELMEYMESGPKTSVYQFSLQLYRVDRKPR